MPIGPGKYDDLCALVRERTNAHGAIVIVFEGDKGSGFSIQAPLEVLDALPAILRTVADDLEKEVKGDGDIG